MKTRWYFWLFLPVLLAACSTLFETTDPAVRLATCIGRAATSLFHNEQLSQLQVECDTQLAGDYVVIISPPRTYTDAELLDKGLSVDTIQKLKLHRRADIPNGIIYVIPRFTTHAGSKSTAYGEYVTITDWVHAAKQSNLVQVELVKSGTDSIAISKVK